MLTYAYLQAKSNIVSTLVVNDLLPLALLVIETVSGLAALILAVILDAVHLAAVQITGVGVTGITGISRHVGGLRSGLGLARVAVVDARAATVLLVATTSRATAASTSAARGATRRGGVITRITGSGGRGATRRGIGRTSRTRRTHRSSLTTFTSRQDISSRGATLKAPGLCRNGR